MFQTNRPEYIFLCWLIAKSGGVGYWSTMHASSLVLMLGQKLNLIVKKELALQTLTLNYLLSDLKGGWCLVNDTN